MKTALIFLCLFVVARGATYYVRTDGNNSNTGLTDSSGGALSQPGGREAHGINGSDPLFVAADNFRLGAGSPGIGAALDLSVDFTTDITGLTRSSPWDIGPYKYLAPTSGLLGTAPIQGNASVR